MSLAADLVGADIMSGDPASVSLLARRMSNLANDVGAMRDRFNARYLGGIWEGEAFEAYARTLEDVPKDLEKVGTSYAMASRAVAAYSGALDHVQRTARDLARQATDAESRVNAADGERVRARREVRLANTARAHAADPVALQEAQRRVQRAAAALSAAEVRYQQASAELSGVHGSAANAVAAFKEDVRLCCQRLHDASEAGIQNTVLSAYDRHVASSLPGIIIAALLSPITAVAEGIVAMAHGDLAAWRGFLDIVGVALLVATVVLLVVGTGGLALVVIGVAGVAVAGAGLWVDHERVRSGEISDDVLAWDSVSLGLSLIPGVAGVFRAVPMVGKVLKSANAGWKTKFIKYGTSGQHLKQPERLQQLRETGEEAFGHGLIEQGRNQVPPRPPQPCSAPQSGLGSSPLAVIRHVRPINPRPVAGISVA